MNKKSANLKSGIHKVHYWSNTDSELVCEARDGLDCRVDLGQQALPAQGVRALAVAWAETQNNHPNQINALYQSYQAVKVYLVVSFILGTFPVGKGQLVQMT